MATVECPFTGDQVARSVLLGRALVELNEDHFAEIVGWLRDCGCEDEQLVGRTNRELVLEVMAQCEGGLAGFARNAAWFD